jgi:uncharacterized membrane protein
VDCFFHANVPSVAKCVDCRKPICATCRDDSGTCPSCRLGAKIDAAAATKKAVAGEVPPRSQQWWQQAQQQAQYQSQPAPQARATIAEPMDSPESRTLVALGYPVWPLALLSLFDRKQSRRLRKHAYQALGFNFGMYGFWALLTFITKLPIISWTPLGWSSDIVLAFMLPIFIVLSVFYGIRAWHGEDVRVPIISDWLDDRMPAA